METTMAVVAVSVEVGTVVKVRAVVTPVTVVVMVVGADTVDVE